MALKNNLLKKFAWVSLSLLILLIGVVSLLVIPEGVRLAESTVMSSAQAVDQPQVAGVSKSIVIESANLVAPTFSTPVVFAMDFDSGQVLYQKNMHQRMYPASTTKILTALVAVDHYQSADMLDVTPDAMVGGSTMRLKPGEKLTFRSLLYGMLLNSGNDAAYTIALNYPGGLDGFVAAMNQKVTDLGLTDSHFTNPAGFDDDNQYVSAYDLATIAKKAAENTEIATVVGTKQTDVDNHELYNLNQLLDIDGVIGFKTGTTDEAGQNFVGLVERKNHKVITVVLGSDNRYVETKRLMDWVYTNYSWVEK